LTVDVVQLSLSITGWGSQSDLPLVLAYVNSVLQTGTRSLLDRAIVDYVQEAKSGSNVEIGRIEEYLNPQSWVKVAEAPFDSSRRLLSVLVSRELSGADEKGLLITKGAVEETLDRCTKVYDSQPSSSILSSGTSGSFKPNNSPPLTADGKQRILETAQSLNEDGLRLVAVACRSTVAMQFMTLTTADEEDLVFIGLLGFLDPVKPDAAEAIKTLATLGVQVVHLYCPHVSHNSSWVIGSASHR
jgi:P-type Mg2+ transporter